jgi:hypothetical protein
MRDSVTQAFGRVWMKTVTAQQVDDIGIYTAKTHVYFNARVPDEKLAIVQSRFDALIQSAVIP